MLSRSNHSPSDYTISQIVQSRQISPHMPHNSPRCTKCQGTIGHLSRPRSSPRFQQSNFIPTGIQCKPFPSSHKPTVYHQSPPPETLQQNNESHTKGYKVGTACRNTPARLKTLALLATVFMHLIYDSPPPHIPSNKSTI